MLTTTTDNVDRVGHPYRSRWSDNWVAWGSPHHMPLADNGRSSRRHRTQVVLMTDSVGRHDERTALTTAVTGLDTLGRHQGTERSHGSDDRACTLRQQYRCQRGQVNLCAGA